ncbi:MAG: hypothetical protein QOK02_775 [Mycobacterium sp.]|jgi:hypothetical protein|nr:hypothetical protein [Mycobacterium sp.]
MLKSAGLELFSNLRMTVGTAYVCERGQAPWAPSTARSRSRN